MKKLSLLVVSVLLSGSAIADECRVRLESTFTHNLVASDEQEVFSGADLTYTDKIKQLLATKEGVTIVPNTVKEKKMVKYITGGCDAGMENEREEEVTVENLKYDYKLIVTQNFKFKNPNSIFYVERKSDRFDVSILPNYTFNTYIGLLNSKGQLVTLQGKKMEFTESQSVAEIKEEELTQKLSKSITKSNWRVMSSIDLIPNCDALAQANK